jgi:spore coat protein H
MRRVALLIGLCAMSAGAACSSDEDVAGAVVFDATRLHEIDIAVDPDDLEALDDDWENRVPCTFTFDGLVIENAGIRQKGGYGSISNLDGKPGFSVKLDELVEGQKLDGLDKLLLNNGIQDPTLLHEHLGYELYRKAGIPAQRTSHAIVTLNGYTYGIYVVAEAVDKRFLRAHFDGLDEGNLYEAGCCVDFVVDPNGVELKDEEEGRSREDLQGFAAAIRETPAEALEGELEARFDLEGFITGYAIDSLVDHWDGYSFNANNYYLYHRPDDDRFVMLPHGMDQLFQEYQRDPFAEPIGELSRRILGVSGLQARYREALRRVMSELWDVEAFHARAELVREVLHSTTRTDERTAADLGGFDENFEIEKQKIADRKSELDGTL